jgi:hypothetical protein
MAGDHRIERFDRVHVVTGVGEEAAVATIDPATVDEERRIDRLPRASALREKQK